MDRVSEFKLVCPVCKRGKVYNTGAGKIDDITEGNPRFPWEVNYECPVCELKASVSEFECYIHREESVIWDNGYIRNNDYEVWLSDNDGNRYSQDGERIWEE